MARPLRDAHAASDSFEGLYRDYATDVYRYALAVVHHEADAEDVTQTTFLNAYRAIERGAQPHSPHNWLIAIAHNVCRQRLRQLLRRPSEVGLDEDVQEQPLPEDDLPNAREIARALASLTATQRAALVLREIKGRSYAEIATELELSPSAVETLIFRARRALREQLDASITCAQAQLAISKQPGESVSRKEKAALRAHLRACEECATLARRQRARRSRVRGIGFFPLPSSLSSLLGGSGSTVVAVASKAVAVVTVAALAGGGAYEGVTHVRANRARAHAQPAPAASVATRARAAVTAKRTPVATRSPVAATVHAAARIRHALRPQPRQVVRTPARGSGIRTPAVATRSGAPAPEPVEHAARIVRRAEKRLRSAPQGALAEVTGGGPATLPGPLSPPDPPPVPNVQSLVPPLPPAPDAPSASAVTGAVPSPPPVAPGGVSP